MIWRNIFVILAALAVAVASAAVTWELLEWRGRAADEACFAAPEPGCLLDAAERIAGTLEEDGERAGALLSVARGRGRTGDMAGMRELLERTTEAALADAAVKEPDMRWPDQTLMSRIVTAWAEAGDRDRALALANEASEPLVRDGRREALVGFLALKGDFEGALAVAASFEDNLVTARLLADITRAALTKGKAPALDQLLARIGAIAAVLDDKTEQIEARSLVGQLQALAGRTEDALATAEALGHAARRDWIIENAVLERARSGEVDEGLALVDRIADPATGVLAFWYAVQSLDNPGDRDTAMALLDHADRIAETIPDLETREYRSFLVRDSRVEFLDTDEALATIETIDDADVRDRMHWTRARKLAEAGDLDKALEVAETISPGIDRTLAMRDVAKAAAAAGDDELVRRIHRLMITDATAQEEDYQRSSALGTVAAYQIELGYLDDAKATLSLADEDFRNSSALQLLAIGHAKSGNIQSALEVAAAISEDDYERNSALAMVAMAAARADDPVRAIEILQMLDEQSAGRYLVQIASPEEKETYRRWRIQGIDYYEPPPPPPAKPAGWDECLAQPNNECMLTLAQAMADREGDWPRIHLRAAAGWEEAGQPDKARDALETSERHARQSYEELQNVGSFSHGGERIWEDIAKGWTSLGEWKRAETLANSAPDEFLWNMQFTLSPLYLAAGNLEASLVWAMKMDASSGRCWRIQLVGQAHRKAGGIDAANKILTLLKEEATATPDKNTRRDCLADLGELQIAMGMVEETLDTATEIAHGREFTSLMRQVAYYQAESGDMETALRTLGAINDPSSQISGYRKLARIASEAGERERADSLTAEAFARSRALPKGDERDGAFRGNAFFQARAGEYDAAFGFLAQIEGPKGRASALRDIADILAKAGERERAALALKQAIESARAIPERSDRDFYLKWTATRQAEADLFDDALESATLLETDYQREDLYSAIAEEQARAGAFDAALQTAELLEDADKLTGALAKIAVQMARKGDIPRAMGLLRQVGPVWASADALVRIVSPDPDRP